MDAPDPKYQIDILANVQRILTEGQFTATYKYALLLASADLAVNATTVGMVDPGPGYTGRSDLATKRGSSGGNRQQGGTSAADTWRFLGQLAAERICLAITRRFDRHDCLPDAALETAACW